MSTTQEREQKLLRIAHRAVREWGAMLDFENHSEENVRRIAQWAWVNHDLELVQEESEGSR